MKLEKLNDSKFENFAENEITELSDIKGGIAQKWVNSTPSAGSPHAGCADVYNWDTDEVKFYC